MNDFIFYWNEEKLISKIWVKMFKKKWNLYIGVFVVHEKNGISPKFVVSGVKCRRLGLVKYKIHDGYYTIIELYLYKLRVITKLPNSEQSYKGKVKTHIYK